MKQATILLRSGGPCSCVPGRYIQWIDLPGVPGLTPAIHCRDVETTGDASKRTHDFPLNGAVVVKVPVMR